MGRPRKYEVVDDRKLPHMTCQSCNCSYPETHFTKTKGKDENGENIRRKTCKTCIYKPQGRDKQKMHLNAIRHRCKQKGIPFDLTYEDLNIPDLCPILGVKLMSWGEGSVCLS